jgi:hypothetical protein
MRKVPNLVKKWCKANGLEWEGLKTFELDDFPDDWEKVSSELCDEGKYENINVEVWEHIDSGRFFQFLTHSLPYGITDYEMMPEELEDIEEVFPVQMTKTEYMTAAQRKLAAKGAKS